MTQELGSTVRDLGVGEKQPLTTFLALHHLDVPRHLMPHPSRPCNSLPRITTHRQWASNECLLLASHRRPKMTTPGHHASTNSNGDLLVGLDQPREGHQVRTAVATVAATAAPLLDQAMPPGTILVLVLALETFHLAMHPVTSRWRRHNFPTVQVASETFPLSSSDSNYNSIISNSNSNNINNNLDDRTLKMLVSCRKVMLFRPVMQQA